MAKLFKHQAFDAIVMLTVQLSVKEECYPSVPVLSNWLMANEGVGSLRRKADKDVQT